MLVISCLLCHCEIEGVEIWCLKGVDVRWFMSHCTLRTQMACGEGCPPLYIANSDGV